ncbi:hypothetical protein MMC16_003146 [Acarospora aff. strigata]|nr:hypothetical protein [Acarospora aff. strigata]
MDGLLYTEEEKWDMTSDFSSDIDDGEMVQQNMVRGTPEDHDGIYREGEGDSSSDLGSAVDDSGPALPVPLRHEVASGLAFAQPPVSDRVHGSSAPSGQAAPSLDDGQAGNTTNAVGDLNSQSKAHTILNNKDLAPSPRRPMQNADSVNNSDSDNESKIDDNAAATKAPLASYTASNSRPIHVSSATAPRMTLEVPGSRLWYTKENDRPVSDGQSTSQGPSLQQDRGSPQIRPTPIFVNRRRGHQAHVVEEDAGTKGSVGGGRSGQTKPKDRAPDISPPAAQEAHCKAYYDRRTGTITYKGLRDGYVYVTKARGPQAISDV